jgi:lipopolysaccharide/colanic/teichoic acid biosynthesis glycosyltransferase
MQPLILYFGRELLRSPNAMPLPNRAQIDQPFHIPDSGRNKLQAAASQYRDSKEENAVRTSVRLTELTVGQGGALKEDAFRALLLLERRRAERSRNPFVLMLVSLPARKAEGPTTQQVAYTVSGIIRESDIIGWYKHEAVLGVIFTEIASDGKVPIVETLRSKVLNALCQNLGPSIVSQLGLTFHQFPETWDKGRPESGADVKLYPEIHEETSKRWASKILKRSVDVAGSGLLLLILAPILAAIALAIKFTSPGPVIFKQQRLGQFGKKFEFLKFRTMHVNNDAGIHREYVQNFIAGKADAEKTQSGPKIYKITNDPRVTPLGRFLRKTSLDELPQFWNVLRGEMSLVGPRPPVNYEFEVYDFWHRRRVLEVKPGVTGLWQVSGRSRTCFDDMVRLDLRYSQEWSLWLDLKILLATPFAVFTGDGAF